MARITGKQLREIKERINRCKQGADDLDQVLEDANLMADILQDIRETIHTAEDTDCIIGIASDLGTNCRPGSDIDEES